MVTDHIVAMTRYHDVVTTLRRQLQRLGRVMGHYVIANASSTGATGSAWAAAVSSVWELIGVVVVTRRTKKSQPANDLVSARANGISKSNDHGSPTTGHFPGTVA
jgi:hypothetical protein